MLVAEAQWFGERIAQVDEAKLFPFCNVGSSTGAFRHTQQPWIESSIFGPLMRRPQGQQILHVDQTNASGVDLVGDLFDADFLERLRSHRFRAVMCSNVLEHVERPAHLAETVTEIVSPGGLLFVSCPRSYPYHPDPIDTGFRPGTNELAELFPDSTVLHSAVVTCGTYAHYLQKGGWTSATKNLGRVFFPLRETKTLWLSSVKHLPWLFRPFQATCLVLQRAA